MSLERVVLRLLEDARLLMGRVTRAFLFIHTKNMSGKLITKSSETDQIDQFWVLNLTATKIASFGSSMLKSHCNFYVFDEKCLVIF